MKTNYRKQAYQPILSSMAAAAVVFAFSPSASAEEPKPDAELLRLEAALDAAGPQSELNIASQNISEYWDKKMADVEKKVARKLTVEERVKFEALKEKWSAYREQQTDFHAAIFAGGSIKPLMASGAYSSITQHRVRELEAMFTDALRGRVDNP